MQVDVSEATQLALNLALLIAAISGAVVWMRRWLQKQVVAPAKAMSEQVMPNGGSQESTRHLIEQMAGDMDQLRQVGQANRDIATAAQTSADLAHKRLDEHIAHHPKEKP